MARALRCHSFPSSTLHKQFPFEGPSKALLTPIKLMAAATTIIFTLFQLLLLSLPCRISRVELTNADPGPRSRSNAYIAISHLSGTECWSFGITTTPLESLLRLEDIEDGGAFGHPPCLVIDPLWLLETHKRLSSGTVVTPIDRPILWP